MDNAIVHYVPELFDLIRQAGAYLHFFPAYGYDLNPVEKVISKARAWLARNRDVAESNPLLAIRRAFASVTATHIAGYYRSCGIAVEEVAEDLLCEPINGIVRRTVCIALCTRRCSRCGSPSRVFTQNRSKS